MGCSLERHREGFLLGHPWKACASYFSLEVKGWACGAVSSLPASETVTDLSSWTPKGVSYEVVLRVKRLVVFM